MTSWQFSLRQESTSDVPESAIPSPSELEALAIQSAEQAAEILRVGYGKASSIGTKSSATDVFTQTDLDSESMIRRFVTQVTPDCGIIGEEGGSSGLGRRLQWIVDPLDGTVNFLYGVPIFAVSVAAAVDGVIVAGAVVDGLHHETYSASLGNGARCNGVTLAGSSCGALAAALVATGFSYTPRLRAAQAHIVAELLPIARDIRCFGSAALHLCWAASGRIDAYFERDTKIWDWAAGSLIASEAGLGVDFPCPENGSLVLAAPPALLDDLRARTYLPTSVSDEP
jgi:myo-inositol-1(or 4)-monophosphatase